jgi:hypothetical protein
MVVSYDHTFLPMALSRRSRSFLEIFATRGFSTILALGGVQSMLGVRVMDGQVNPGSLWPVQQHSPSYRARAYSCMQMGQSGRVIFTLIPCDTIHVPWTTVDYRVPSCGKYRRGQHIG